MRRMRMFRVHIMYTHGGTILLGRRDMLMAEGKQTHLYGKLFLMLLMRQSVVSFSLFAQAATHLNASPPLWLAACLCVCSC